MVRGLDEVVVVEVSGAPEAVQIGFGHDFGSTSSSTDIPQRGAEIKPSLVGPANGECDGLPARRPASWLTDCLPIVPPLRALPRHRGGPRTQPGLRHRLVPPGPDASLSARIRARLATRIDEIGIPIARLARRSGVSEGTIHRLLNKADCDVYIRTLVAIARALGVGIQDLFNALARRDAPPASPTPDQE